MENEMNMQTLARHLIYIHKNGSTTTPIAKPMQQKTLSKAVLIILTVFVITVFITALVVPLAFLVPKKSICS